MVWLAGTVAVMPVAELKSAAGPVPIGVPVQFEVE